MTYQEYLASIGQAPGYDGMTHMPQVAVGDKGAAVLDFLDQMRRSSGEAVRAGIQGDYGQFGGLLADAMGPGIAAKGLMAAAPAIGSAWLAKRMWGKSAPRKGGKDMSTLRGKSKAPSIEEAMKYAQENGVTLQTAHGILSKQWMADEVNKLDDIARSLQPPPLTGRMPVEGDVAPYTGLLGDVFRRQGGKVGSKPPRMSREEAIAAGYWHPIGDAKKLKVPFEEMTRETTPAYGLLAQKRADLERMQGGELIPAPGDRSDAGKYLTSVNQTRLANPVLLEGGHGFMRSHSPHGAVWASGKGVVTGLNKQAQSALERGVDPYLAYLPMGHGSIDFNTMMSDAVLEQIRGGNVSKTAKQLFDRKMRKLRPEWLGIDHPQATQMLESNGALRHAFMDTAQLEDFQRRGFPDLAATRKAITDPALYDTGLLHGGQSFGRLSGQVIDAPAMPHKTYDTQLGGEYVGGINEGIPPQLMFPDFYAARRAAGKPPQSDYRSFSLSQHSQPMNQQWLDNIMGYLGRNSQAN